MAIILDQITVGNHLIYSLQEDPRTGSGTPAVVGTIAMVHLGNPDVVNGAIDKTDISVFEAGEVYLKVGVADTAWRIISTSVTSQISVEPGDFRHLAIYKTDANGDVLNDEFSENGGGTIEVVVAADATRATSMTYQFPVVPGSITSAEVVLTESDQLINGDKTFNDNVVILGDLTYNAKYLQFATFERVVTVDHDFHQLPIVQVLAPDIAGSAFTFDAWTADAFAPFNYVIDDIMKYVIEHISDDSFVFTQDSESSVILVMRA
jgi:hypothetical protein